MSKLYVVGAVAACAAAPVCAQPYTYADAGGALVMFDGEALSNPDGDYNAATLQGRIGYAFNDFFAVELDLGVGVSDAEATDEFFGTEDTISIGTFSGIYGRVGFSPIEQVHLFVKGGAVGGDLDIEIVDAFSGTVLASGDGGVNGLGFGAGAQVNLSDTLYLRGDYTRYDLEDDGVFEIEADVFSLGIGLKF